MLSPRAGTLDSGEAKNESNQPDEGKRSTSALTSGDDLWYHQLRTRHSHAVVAELADALDSGSSGLTTRGGSTPLDRIFCLFFVFLTLKKFNPEHQKNQFSMLRKRRRSPQSKGGDFSLGKKVELQKALERFLLVKKAAGLSETTLEDYRRHVNYFFRRYPEAWDDQDELKEATLRHISEANQPATRNLRLIYLRAFLKWCKQEGYIAENPLENIKPKKAQPRIVDIPVEKLKELLELPDQRTFAGLRDYALILFQLDTGIRPKEAFHLLIDDFDLNRGLVHVRAEIAKTRMSRTLPISPTTVRAIEKLIEARHPKWPKDLPVFCSADGTIMNKNTWKNRMKKYAEQLGIKIRPYDLRHAFALEFLRSGGHAFALQALLGHTDLSMTKRYLNITQKDLRDQHAVATPLKKILSSRAGALRVRKIEK